MTRSLQKIQETADHRAPRDQWGGPAEPPTRARFLARVGVGQGPSTGPEAVISPIPAGTAPSDAARWLYPWQAVEIGHPPLYPLVAVPGLGSAWYGRAVNLAELTHVPRPPYIEWADNSWIVGDIQANPAATGSTYPTGFSPRPIGERLPVVVEMWFVRTRATEGHPATILPVFHCRNAHDGACTV